MTLAIDLLCRALGRRDELYDAEMQILSSLVRRNARYTKGAEIISEGSRPTWSCLLQSGWAARALHTASGARQITALHVPGDFVDLHGFLLKQMDHSIVALSDCEVVFIPHANLQTISEEAPHLTRLLWLATTIDAAIQRKMTALIGRHTPVQRLCHLFCELYLRLDVVGLATDGRFRFPLTQTELADILGLSVVHTNRTVQDLRATNLAMWTESEVFIPNFDKLAEFAQFDPAYLNLQSEPR